VKLEVTAWSMAIGTLLFDVGRGGGGWKCSGPPAGNCARSNPNSQVQTLVAYATKVRHRHLRETHGIAPLVFTEAMAAGGAETKRACAAMMDMG